jgi:DNA-binding Lrp family transcriptional regulator
MYSFCIFAINKNTISTTKLHIDTFKSKFENIDSISVNDIFSFYQKHDSKVKKSTVSWRIYNLVDKGIIQRIGKGKYKLGKQKEFTPIVSKENQNLYLKLKEEFPFLDISIWSTKWVAQWMLHIPNNYETIIEVEKGSEENVFYFLSDIRDNVFLNPSKDILDKYANRKKSVIIVKNLITDAPLQDVEQVKVPSIEKILVDLIVNTELYTAYQGRDLDSIIENAFQYNTIKKDTLLRYADRRRKKPFVKERIYKNDSK